MLFLKHCGRQDEQGCSSLAGGSSRKDGNGCDEALIEKKKKLIL